jgi:hypothetical protein
MTSYLIVIPVGPGWHPGQFAVQQVACTGHPVWISAAGVSELLTTPGMEARCVLHLPPGSLDNVRMLDSVAEQFREETGREITPGFQEAMVRYYKRFSG